MSLAGELETTMLVRFDVSTHRPQTKGVSHG